MVKKMKILPKGLFIFGIMLAIIATFFSSGPKLIGLPLSTFIIVLAGFFIGIMNLKSSKTSNFLVTTIALLFMGNAGLFVAKDIGILNGMIINILAFIGPAAILVAIKAVIEITNQ